LVEGKKNRHNHSLNKKACAGDKLASGYHDKIEDSIM